MLLRDQIRSAADNQREAVTVPEWGGVTVYIHCISAVEMEAFGLELKKASPEGNAEFTDSYRARMLARCMYDEAGNRIFSPEQAGELAVKNNKVIHRLYLIAERLNKVEDPKNS